MKYRLVIFDFDGTLADSFPFFLQAVNMLADVHGFRKIGRDELDALRGHDARQVLSHVGLPMWKVPRVAAHYRQLMAQHADRIALFEDTSAMLHELAAHGIVLALVTSNSYDNVCHTMGPENSALIAHHECGVSLFGKRSKLRKILDKSGVPAQHALYIGDELRDFDAARAEGLAFGAVGWGYTRFDVLLARQPECAFSKVSDIAEKLIGSQTA
jgi:phosphoglycolate phosphatase